MATDKAPFDSTISKTEVNIISNMPGEKVVILMESNERKKSNVLRTRQLEWADWTLLGKRSLCTF